MKNTQLITMLAVLAATSAVCAEETKTTTTEYMYVRDGEGSGNSSSTSTSRTKSVIAERRTDKSILMDLDEKIDSYPDLDDDVSFKVDDGAVTLSGRVENTSERDHAGMLAAEIKGVVSVDNLIDTE
ncbi:MAG: BON domain-containing protein [Candidatus Caenarcaniphilales bacterium]|jgi:osmotically-inducible protein OsmY|nr:BON domain-containing protein [Candidatus Caenarcaniphilales bacterium]